MIGIVEARESTLLFQTTAIVNVDSVSFFPFLCVQKRQMFKGFSNDLHVRCPEKIGEIGIEKKKDRCSERE